MPLYEYECEACSQRFEVIQKYSDSPPDACRKCGKGPVHRLQSSPAFQFKGSGWYVTDYASKSKGDSGKSEASSTEAKPADGTTKAESAPKADAPAASASPSSTAKE
jgi:putative FmdB family regulatory protein